MKQVFYPALLCLISCKALAFNGEGLLFLIHAEQAMFMGHENQGNATLMLLGVSPSVVYFTQPSEHRSGSVPLSLFLEEWGTRQERFEKQSYDAGFVFYEGEQDKYHAISVELQKPIYNPMTKSLQFEVRLLNAFDKGAVSDVTLFIDNRPVIAATRTNA